MRRVAVVGCGDVSIVHFEAIARLADVELVGVCDVDSAAAARAHEQCGSAGVPRSSGAAGGRPTRRRTRLHPT